jgi:NDP-sugar pyrophosphorylase family protein
MSPIKTALPEAIILCGGKGERLRPITNDIPKPLVKINENPILHYVIEHLKNYNITKIHIASGYKSNVIRKHFLDTHYDSEIAIYDSGDVDIIKRVQDILLTVKNDVIILYGDTISDVNINKLVNSHRESAKEMSMTVWPLKISYGLVEIDDNDIVSSFVEKPTLDKWINIGYFYIKKSYRNTIYEFDSFVKFLCESANAESINAYKHHGLHITVNTLSELEDAKKSITDIIKI